MHMPPTVCPLLEPTDRHTDKPQASAHIIVTYLKRHFGQWMMTCAMIFHRPSSIILGARACTSTQAAPPHKSAQAHPHSTHMQAAARGELWNVVPQLILRLAHPGPRCAHTEERPLPRPAATASPSIRQLSGPCDYTRCHIGQW
jgi:hypothetical protein